MTLAGGPALAVIALGLAAFLLSAGINAWLIARPREGLAIDLPGARRMHKAPTPRGGGMGIALAVLLFGLGPFLPVEPRPLVPIIIGVLTVAVVSWLDDRRGVPAGWRLVAHCLGAALVVWALAPELPGVPEGMKGLGVLMVGVALTISLVWSINLHNFMDGIDGLLAMQAAFVAGFLLALPSVAGDVVVLVPAAATVAASLGFLPYNFPRARIFMGDVGSTVIGLVIALLLLLSVRHGHLSAAAALVLPILFVTDASLTLASRMFRGRRWYHGHREHLYQWLARSSGSHVPVSAGFLLVNLAAVAPTVLLIRARPEHGTVVAVIAYAVAGGLWFALRRWVLARRRRG